MWDLLSTFIGGQINLARLSWHFSSQPGDGPRERSLVFISFKSVHLPQPSIILRLSRYKWSSSRDQTGWSRPPRRVELTNNTLTRIWSSERNDISREFESDLWRMLHPQLVPFVGQKRLITIALHHLSRSRRWTSSWNVLLLIGLTLKGVHKQIIWIRNIVFLQSFLDWIWAQLTKHRDSFTPLSHA